MRDGLGTNAALNNASAIDRHCMYARFIRGRSLDNAAAKPALNNELLCNPKWCHSIRDCSIDTASVIESLSNAVRSIAGRSACIDISVVTRCLVGGSNASRIMPDLSEDTIRSKNLVAVDRPPAFL